MVYKYIYIDDTKNQIEQGTINGLQDGEEIQIIFRYPNDWEKLIKELLELIPLTNGLILDLRLNETAYAEGKSATYRGSTIAQELRTLAKEGEIKVDFPIVLVSANEKLETSLDQTSKDLFDTIISKNEIGSKFSYADFRQKLKWLAEGYLKLSEFKKTPEEILKIPPNIRIDLRFIDLFVTTIQNQANHVIARFVTKEVIGKPTFLINEQYLATRLGINLASPDWKPFLERYFDDCKYLGAFSNYYPRWWMPLIEKVWSEKISSELSFRNTEAKKKVELLIEKTEFKNLQPIIKTGRSKSDTFWVNCKATGVPIDTIDGFLIAGQDANYPWQELEYLSISEALRPTSGYSVSPVERPRLQKLKQLLETYEQRVRR